jgi:hypothetical protein
MLLTAADGCSLSIDTLTVIPNIYHICTVKFGKFIIHSANNMEPEEERYINACLITHFKEKF